MHLLQITASVYQIVSPVVNGSKINTHKPINILNIKLTDYYLANRRIKQIKWNIC